MNESESQFMASIYSALAESNSLSFRTFIERKIDELGISQRQFSKATGIQNTSLQNILSGKQQKIDLVTFLKMSQFLGIQSHELSQLFVAELEADSVRELEKARRAGYIIRTFNLKGLKQCKFIKDIYDFESIEERIKQFFQLDSIFDYDSLLRIPLFSRTRRSASDKMLQFWCSTVFHELRLINNPHPYDRDLVRQILPKIRAMSCDEETGLLAVARALFSAGVTVIVHSYVSKTQIRGATFVVNDKPCVVLQDFRGDYATLWFALSHELYHVLWDFDRMRHLKYHISGPDNADNATLFDDQLTEYLANEFASELLLPSDKREFIAQFIDLPATVKSYAEKWGVHEAIIYGQYSYHFKDYHFPKKEADKAIRRLMIHPWEAESLTNVVADLQLT